MNTTTTNPAPSDINWTAILNTVDPASPASNDATILRIKEINEELAKMDQIESLIKIDRAKKRKELRELTGKRINRISTAGLPRVSGKTFAKIFISILIGFMTVLIGIAVVIALTLWFDAMGDGGNILVGILLGAIKVIAFIAVLYGGVIAIFSATDKIDNSH